jgi:hypothetical protein
VKEAYKGNTAMQLPNPIRFVFAYLAILFLPAVALSQPKKLAAIPQPSRLIDKLLKSKAPLARLDSESLPGMKEARERLTRPVCAAAIGGRLAYVAETRMISVEYYRFAVAVISAETKANGEAEVVYAFSNVGNKRVLLFDAFWQPNAVLTKMASGGATEMNFMRDWEKMLGLKPGSLTTGKFQAITLLHENAHQNGTAVLDIQCLGLSVLNTQWVIDSCMPELINPDPSVVASFAKTRSQFRKVQLLGGDVERACNNCHLKAPS